MRPSKPSLKTRCGVLSAGLITGRDFQRWRETGQDAAPSFCICVRTFVADAFSTVARHPNHLYHGTRSQETRQRKVKAAERRIAESWSRRLRSTPLSEPGRDSISSHHAHRHGGRCDASQGTLGRGAIPVDLCRSATPDSIQD